MDDSARAPSDTRSTSSSASDFYDTDAAPAYQPANTQPAESSLPESAESNIAQPETNGADNAEDDDSSSEMDLSEPSRPATPLPPATDASAAIANHAGTKRKLSDALDADSIVAALAEDPAKKRKTSSTSEQPNGSARTPPPLPAEIWQRIFLHLSPAMLCRNLRVCKTFNSYLTSMKAGPIRKPHSIAQVMDSEAIWTHSRKTFFPMIPRPLAGFTEHGMLKLVGGLFCQFCERDLPQPTATSHLNAGPGPNGLRVIWPFGIRCCGLCLESRVLKDVQVLSDPRFGALRLGVPHGYRSLDLHFASESARQLPGGIPANLRFSKIHYVPDLETVKAEEEDAKTLGNGAADEWRKGLAARGKEAMTDSARWEKWELQMRPGTNLAHVLREYDAICFPQTIGAVQSRSAGMNGTQPSMTANGGHPLPQPVHVFQNAYAPPLQLPVHSLQQQQHFRPVRNPHEVELARQARRADIERRCRELEPPLEPNVLQHMESYQAAMQIATPMTDAAWEMLRPRILAQRETAELAEHERATQLAALRATLPFAPSEDMTTKPAKEVYDREYEQAQEPLRKRLGEYADDYINGQWNGGKLLDKDNAPIFAINVIMQVRRRYAEDKSLGLLSDVERPKTRGSHHGTPPPEPFLSLDNMKWVHDHKVRPLTDVHRRELFICDGCVDQKQPKWFAFEGLIQHYGAKHTTSFSKGNIVVHWQTAEWPEEPPFHTNPAHWLRPDRRTHEQKGSNRPRNTPHNGHVGPFPTPSSGARVSETSFQAANGSHISPVYPLHQFGGPNGYFHPQVAPGPAPAGPRDDPKYDEKLSQLSNDSREIWDSLDGIKDLEGCVRMQTVIHHAVSRFVDRFQQTPELDLLTDALATNTSMRPLKNAHGLVCKCCIAAITNGVSNPGSYWARIRGAKLYNTSSLITHFKLMHLSQNQPGYLDWTRDMIELPEHNILKELLQTPGMDDDKLALIAMAFPGAFPNPLPRIGTIAEKSAASADEGVFSNLLERFTKKQKGQQKKKGPKPSNGHVKREDSQEPLPEPTEDEYDPRRPMFVKVKEEFPDPARFDTDARNPVAPAQPEPTAAFSLNPETLAALQSLSAATSLPPPAQQHRMRSRSPSVGRQNAGTRNVMSKKVSTPTDQPDIAAILAALTGQAASAQTSTSQSVSSRVEQPLHRIHNEQHARPQYAASPTNHDEARRSSARYDSGSQPVVQSPAANTLHDLQAALSRNTRQFEQNQHHTYHEAAAAPAPAHSSATPAAHHSAPRYHYVYEGDQHYGHPAAQTPTYRETPVQYVQLPPEREQTHHGYHQYERAQPKPIYVDQYGQPVELIPIDSAPAPVQYAPSRYEPQYQPMYNNMATTAHYQPVYEERRAPQTYYAPVNGVQQRYGYDDGRASVPRP